MERTPEEILAREDRQRKPAAIAAVLATIVTALAVILDQVIAAAGVPEPKNATDLVEAMSAQLGGTEFPKSFWSAYATFKIDHGAETMLVAALRGIALISFAPLAFLLLRGARERGGQLAKFLEPLVVIGLVGAGAATIAAGIVEISAFKSAQPELYPKDVLEALNGSSVLTVNTIKGICTLIAAVPIALGAVQALRVGLLPRIIGFMGVAVGLLFVIPYDETGLLRAIWFAIVAWIVMGRSKDGLPEAWAKGHAVTAGPRLPPAPRGPKGGKKGDAEFVTEPARGKNKDVEFVPRPSERKGKSPRDKGNGPQLPGAGNKADLPGD